MALQHGRKNAKPRKSQSPQKQMQDAGQQQPSFMQAPPVPMQQNPGQQMFDPTQALGTGMTP